jgi:hypothetical protein
MKTEHYLYAFLLAFFLGLLNSWYWYKQGYRGGRLLFLGTIAFFGIIVLILKGFFS